MAKHLQFCSALFLSASVFLTGCQVDVQDPNNPGNGNPSPTNTPPVITLVGESTITIPVNTAYSEPGVVATDAEDGDLTSAVSVDSSKLNTSVPGQYEITYQVKDSGNLAATPVKRIVIVAPAAVDPEEPSEDPTAVLPPPITDLRLVGFTSAREIVDVTTIQNGSVIDLSQTSVDLLNVVADSADVSKTGSVHFKLSGPISVDRWENNAIYTMVVDTVNLSVSKGQFPEGDYTLSVTPYSLPDMAGTKGAVKTVSFKVTDKKIVTNVPKIAAVELVSVAEGGQYSPITRLAEGTELDFGKMSASLVNFIAISEDVAKTGSVHFDLTGPIEINRYENTAAFALQNETKHFSLNKNELPEGEYTLIVTPYEKPDTGGEAGIPLMLNFSVVNKGQVPQLPASAPEAKNDSYTYFAGNSDQPGEATPVSANDTFAAGAKFAVTKNPSHGSVSMFDAGYFTYTPDSGYSGADSFTYQITQDGKTSSATVSINVVAASSGGSSGSSSSGFTVIKPSADSKLIYVSSSTGKDTNNCLSEAAPCKTITAGLEKMRNGYPDHLYLKRGDVWRGERFVNLHSGRSAKEPAVITYYGTSGARPKLENSSAALHVFKGKMSNFSFIGLDFSSYTRDPAHKEFTGGGGADITLLGGNENLLFEDNKFSYTEVIIQQWDSGKPTNITFRRNIWTGAYVNQSSYNRDKRPSNIYADGVIGLIIEENVIDQGGWNPKTKGAGANMFNHNIYIQASTEGKSLRLRNNIITRGSSHGAQLRSGGIAENNFFARNALGLLIGYDKTPLVTGVVAHAINNVVSEGHSMVKGIDACNGANLCTAALVGVDFGIYGKADWQAHGNIASQLSPDDTQWRSKYSGLVKRGLNKLDDPAVKSSNNISYAWGSDSEGKDKGYPDPTRTLASYNQTLGGEKSFDAFMNVVLNRPVGTWDTRYTAESINKYIRAGFGR